MRPRVRFAEALGQRRTDAGSFELLIEPAGDGEDRIADLLGGEPAAVVVPIQAVFAVDFCRQRNRFVSPLSIRGLAINFGRQDQPMESLDVPAAGDKLVREPIEQFGMCGRGRLSAEVVRIVDETAAEMALPDAIDDHAGDQWIFGIGQPAGQGAAASAHTGKRDRDLGRRLGRLREDGEKPGLHFAKRLVVAAAGEQNTSSESVPALRRSP